MATVYQAPTAVRQEQKFFFVMACVMAATIVAGFSFNLASGRSSFAVPLVFHVHALVFFAWVVLYVTQNALVFTGSVALHRRLGMVSAIWVPLMIVMGGVMTVESMQLHGGPPFFDQNEFMMSNPLQLLAFGALTLSAVVLRNRSDWHRRLMFVGMAVLTTPGIGRLLPMPFLIPYAWWIALSTSAIFVVAAMIADKRRSGRVHPAWFVGIAAVVGTQVIADAIAYSPAGYAITHFVIDGTPGADRPMKAFFPA